MVLQLKLALFQAPQLQLVMPGIAVQQFDDGIQITVLNFQLDDSTLYFFRWCHDLC